MNIALYGGSFDPPHLGHVHVVHAALKTLDIDKIIVVPAFVNPFKSGTHAPAELRLKWLQEIFEDDKNNLLLNPIEHFLKIEPCSS